MAVTEARRRSMAFPKRSLLFAAAWSAWTAQAQDVLDSPHTLQLDGACASKDFLNSLTYERQGYTLGGSPYYKARGVEEYLYYDEDCANMGDGSARWILDSDRPALDREADLDNDGFCEYHARINSLDITKPTLTGTWRMKCDGVWKNVDLTLLVITSTSTTTTSTTTSTTSSTTTTTSTTMTTSSTTTSSTTTSTTGTSSTTTSTTTSSSTTTSTSTTVTTTSTTTTTTTLMWFHVSGMCEYKDFLNNLVFREAGSTANGAPYFKSLVGEQYVYYDMDCNADGRGGEPRWIIDSDAPIVSNTVDLDGDGGCMYHARIDSVDIARPPAEGQWQVFCGSEWQARNVSFDSSDAAILEEHLHASLEAKESNATSTVSDTAEEPQFTTTSTTTSTATNTTTTRTSSTSTRTQTPHAARTIHRLSLDGACEDKAFLGTIVFELQGHTASGAPYYKAETHTGETHYIYYDPACGGAHGIAKPRWIIDTDAPNVASEADLDNDGACEYYARTTGTSLHLPTEAVWRVWCGSVWEDYTLSLVEHDDGEGSILSAAMPATSSFAAFLAVGAVALTASWRL